MNYEPNVKDTYHGQIIYYTTKLNLCNIIYHLLCYVYLEIKS